MAYIIPQQAIEITGVKHRQVFIKFDLTDGFIKEYTVRLIS